MNSVDEMQPNSNNARIGIVGGGIAGATVALCLGEQGLDVTLLEKSPSLVNGPPICHLHAGGNLYREISDTQCLTLLRESIDLLRLYPNAVDYRPTVIAIPTNDNGLPADLLPRLEKLKLEYQRLITADVGNKVLGEAEQYFKIFEREQVEALKNVDIVDRPNTLTEWMIPVAHYVDLEQIKFPIIMVQEYGLNLFRLAASAELALQNMPNCEVSTCTTVTNIQKNNEKWNVEFQRNGEQEYSEFDYLINAAGFRSGLVDDMLGLQRKRLVEFKAAYVTHWKGCTDIWPELIFFGERGTPNGMAQFTPYPEGHFQLHGMTESITLFENGLAESSDDSAQPKLKPHFINKIDKGWPEEEVALRSQGAINHLSRFIPEFAQDAAVSSKPLFGAQQIPGDDADLRAAGVSFVGEHYARCEIVKASSAPSVADEILKQLVALGFHDATQFGARDFLSARSISASKIDAYAASLCKSRNYPQALSRCNIAENS